MPCMRPCLHGKTIFSSELFPLLSLFSRVHIGWSVRPSVVHCLEHATYGNWPCSFYVCLSICLSVSLSFSPPFSFSFFRSNLHCLILALNLCQLFKTFSKIKYFHRPVCLPNMLSFYLFLAVKGPRTCLTIRASRIPRLALGTYGILFKKRTKL